MPTMPKTLAEILKSAPPEYRRRLAAVERTAAVVLAARRAGRPDAAAEAAHEAARRGLDVYLSSRSRRAGTSPDALASALLAGARKGRDALRKQNAATAPHMAAARRKLAAGLPAGTAEQAGPVVDFRKALEAAALALNADDFSKTVERKLRRALEALIEARGEEVEGHPGVESLEAYAQAIGDEEAATAREALEACASAFGLEGVIQAPPPAQSARRRASTGALPVGRRVVTGRMSYPRAG